MKIWGLLYLLLCCATGFADDGSARRFAVLERDDINSKFFLISIKSVQSNLRLTEEQVVQLKNAMMQAPTNIPSVVEFSRLKAKALTNATSELEKSEIKKAGNQKVHLLILQYWEAALQQTLSAQQQKRLDELFCQMKGPLIILENTNVAAKLSLSTSQLEAMREVGDENTNILHVLKRRILRLQIQPIRKRELDDVEAELACVQRVIREVEKDQDAELLAVLDDKQGQVWGNTCGAPLSIDWKMDSFADVPFEQDELKQLETK